MLVLQCGWEWGWEGLVMTGGVTFKKSKIVLGDMALVFSVAAYVLLRVLLFILGWVLCWVFGLEVLGCG